ncbi:Na-Ca-ex domain-containing protein [Mycena indigotica]|uniref:Na-Ca-ex domain-containing protein n=1 Tax=Mycena indigotica TaxID=2126181 RepID=A0A8H6W1G7_9AGAR|nr:Na-Ca-ex domain-containing protein [Mycena indigotica]KAF7301532.1 Na-Ca-ex domain-containing protein [Mycena indigotica]
MPARTYYGSPAYSNPVTVLPFTSPPPLNYTRYAQLPVVQESTLHWALDAQNASSLRCNVFNDPTAHILPPLNPRILAEVAVQLPSVTILVSRFRLTIHPSSRKSSFVTVADVLHGIHRYLCQPLPRHEMAEISPEDFDAARFTHYSRCRGMDRIAADSEPLRRIDLLGGNQQFCGLQRTVDSPDYWILCLS